MNRIISTMLLMLCFSISIFGQVKVKGSVQFENVIESNINGVSEFVDSFRLGDAALFVFGGQSNQSGTTANPEDATDMQFSNVFVMKAGTRVFTEFEIADNNVWSTANAIKPNGGNAMALAWQTRINNGEDLPDLYIINVSSGNTGMSWACTNVNTHWNPQRWKQNRIGKYKVQGLGIDPDYSMFDLLQNCIESGIDSLKSDGKRVIVLGASWSQWNNDKDNITSVTHYLSNVTQLRSMISKASGVDNIPFYYWSPPPSGNTLIQDITEVYDYFESTNHNVIKIDLQTFTDWPTVYIADGIHYKKSVQEEGAEKILSNALDSGRVLGLVSRR